MSNKKMELKAVRLLADIRGELLNKIQHQVRNKVEYFEDKPDEVFKLMEFISNPAKWDYCGLLHKEDIKVMEVLEYLIDDKQDGIIPYKEWKPMKKE